MKKTKKYTVCLVDWSANLCTKIAVFTYETDANEYAKQKNSTGVPYDMEYMVISREI